MSVAMTGRWLPAPRTGIKGGEEEGREERGRVRREGVRGWMGAHPGGVGGLREGRGPPPCARAPCSLLCVWPPPHSRILRRPSLGGGGGHPAPHALHPQKRRAHLSPPRPPRPHPPPAPRASRRPPPPPPAAARPPRSAPQTGWRPGGRETCARPAPCRPAAGRAPPRRAACANWRARPVCLHTPAAPTARAASPSFPRPPRSRRIPWRRRRPGRRGGRPVEGVEGKGEEATWGEGGERREGGVGSPRERAPLPLPHASPSLCPPRASSAWSAGTGPPGPSGLLPPTPCPHPPGSPGRRPGWRAGWGAGAGVGTSGRPSGPVRAWPASARRTAGPGRAG